MFQNLNKPAFGATGTNTYLGGFGAANANPFGQPQPFGKPATTGFGNTPSAFGQSAAPLFGAQTQHGTNLFGSNANTSSFGQTPTTQSAFGSTLFGTPPQPTTSGLFGASTSNPSFGQQNKSGFGFATPGQSSVFGTPQNNPQATNSLFNPSASTSNVFGTASATPFSLGIGGAPTGTVIKFSHVTGTDTMQKGGLTQPISTRHHSITCMKEYEDKSFEELRWEDYQADRKGPQQTAFGSSPFGATPTSAASSLFGAPENKSVFAPNSSFGQANTFGTPPSQPQVGAGGLFGKPTNTFGTNTTNSTTFGFANNATTSSPFGNTIAVAKPFGAATSSQSLFGGTSQTPGTFGVSSFGQPNQNAGFFKPTQPNTFGSVPTNTFSGFGAPATQSNNSLFQPAKNASGVGLFGQPTAQPTSFGQSTFNQPNANPFGSFNKPTASLFGGTGTTNALNTNNTLGQNNSFFAPKPNLFGANSSTGLFGNTNTFNTGNNFSFGPPQNQTINAQEQSAANTAELLQLAGSPFGISNHLSGLSPSSRNHDINRTTNPSELRTLIDTTFQNTKKSSPNNNKIRVTPMVGRKSSLFEGLDESENILTSSGYQVKGSAKRLVIRDKHKSALEEGGFMNSGAQWKGVPHPPNLVPYESKSSSRKDLEPVLFNKTFLSTEKTSETSSTTYSEHPDTFPDTTPLSVDKYVEDSIIPSCNNTDRDSSNSGKDDDDGGGDGDSITVGTDTQNADGSPTNPHPNVNAHPTGIILHRPEYYTVPPLDELPKYIAEDGTCIVKGFTIGRVGYGNVYFLDPINVRNLNIDELVHFRHKELTIYPDDTKKPALGEGLNRRAQVTLDRVWPRDKIEGAPITNPDRLLAMDYAGKLKRISEKHSSRFVEYRPETGSWVFRVEHFSKYGLSDSDDEEAAAAVKNVVAAGAESFKKQQQLGRQLPIQTAMSVDEEKDELDTVPLVTGLNTTDADYLFEEMDLLNQSNMTKYTLQDDPEFMHSISVMKAAFFQQPQERQQDYLDIVSVSACEESSDDMEAIYDNDDTISDTSVISNDFVPVCYAPECKELLLNGKVAPQCKSTFNSRTISDVSIFKGRSYKVGWGPGNTLLTLTTRNDSEKSCNTWLAGRHSEDFSAQLVQRMEVKNLTEVEDDPFGNTLDAHMQVQLNASVVQMVNQVATFQVPLDSKIVEKHHKITNEFSLIEMNSNSEQVQYYNIIMELVMAFWSCNDPNSDVDPVTERKEKFSAWLEKAVHQTVKERLKVKNKLTLNETLENLLTYLSGHQIANATNLALSKSLNRLSLLISQVNSSNYVRSLLQTQIRDWEKQNATNHIEDAMIKLYLLCSGKMMLGAVNICEDMDWKQALALHFWYICPLNAPLTTAVAEYERTYMELEYVAKPSPINHALSHDQDIDIAFHLMKLYTDNTYPVNNTLNYSTHTDDPLDYRFSWILLQVLKSLGVGYISQESERYLHLAFASQLENLGLWKWSIYVLSFLQDYHIKKHHICNVIERNIPIEISRECLESEKILIKEFIIPPKWIHKAKAIKSLHMMRYWDAVKYFTLLEDFQSAHHAAFEHLLPSLVINEHYDVLQQVLRPFCDASREIHEWEYQGGLILDFVELLLNFGRRTDDACEELHHVQASLSSICKRVQFFTRNTAYHKLCIAELSKHIAFLVEKWFKAHVNQDKRLNQTAKQYIQQLLLPSGYRELGLVL